MPSVRYKPLGLRTRLTAWTSLVLVIWLGVGFAWVHFGLRSVLQARDDAFLERKASELEAALRDGRAFDEEVRREVDAYEAQGLVVVVRQADSLSVSPEGDLSRELAHRLADLPGGGGPLTLKLSAAGGRYRALRRELDLREGRSILGLGITLGETETTLSQFDARVATGGVLFLGLAIGVGLILSREAMRPVAQSIRTAKGLSPSNLSARLPLTGADDELDHLAATINDLLDRLAAYHAQAIRFTADASHELRGPLAAMRSAVEVVLQQPRTAEEYRESLVTLAEQCDRLATLVNGLLLLARADAGEVELRAERVDVAVLAFEVAEMFEPLAEEKGVELSWSSPKPVFLWGDPSRLRQLLTNLVDNAIKFTGPGGRVSLAVRPENGRALVTVTDTGIGIPAEHLPHVFARFYQTDQARSSGGSGLGLSICEWIAKAHGGSIEVTCGQGPGTTVTAKLPEDRGERQQTIPSPRSPTIVARHDS
jgi:heavy metal sensor kinase